MLAGVDQHLPKTLHRAQRLHERRDLHVVRPRADDVDDGLFIGFDSGSGPAWTWTSRAGVSARVSAIFSRLRTRHRKRRQRLPRRAQRRQAGSTPEASTGHPRRRARSRGVHQLSDPGLPLRRAHAGVVCRRLEALLLFPRRSSNCRPQTRARALQDEQGHDSISAGKTAAAALVRKLVKTRLAERNARARSDEVNADS